MINKIPIKKNADLFVKLVSFEGIGGEWIWIIMIYSVWTVCLSDSCVISLWTPLIHKQMVRLVIDGQSFTVNPKEFGLGLFGVVLFFTYFSGYQNCALQPLLGNFFSVHFCSERAQWNSESFFIIVFSLSLLHLWEVGILIMWIYNFCQKRMLCKVGILVDLNWSLELSFWMGLSFWYVLHSFPLFLLIFKKWFIDMNFK